MGVGLGDDPDRRPPGVSEHDTLDVGAELSASCSRGPTTRSARSDAVLSPSSPISAAALYTRTSTPSTSRAERVVNSRSERAASACATTGSAGSSPCPVSCTSTAGRVATADLEPIEGRERLVDAEEHRRGPHRRDPPRRAGHLLRGPQPVAADGPEGVAATDQRGVGRARARRRDSGHGRIVERRPRPGCTRPPSSSTSADQPGTGGPSPSIVSRPGTPRRARSTSSSASATRTSRSRRSVAPASIGPDRTAG